MAERNEWDLPTPEELQELLDHLEMEPKTFALRIGQTPSQVSKWLRGLVVMPPWMAIIIRLAMDHPAARTAIKDESARRIRGIAGRADLGDYPLLREEFDNDDDSDWSDRG